MIRNIEELLQGFMNEETEKLNAYELKSGPTIGDMSEGLSVDLLSRAIPPQINLQIVDGFVTDSKNFYLTSGCMLVRCEGIAYTKSFKWHVKDVLFVF